MTLDAELFADVRQTLDKEEICLVLKDYLREKGLLTDAGRLPGELEKSIDAALARSKSKHREYSEMGLGRNDAKAIHSAVLG
jgi:hypothetical protein